MNTALCPGDGSLGAGRSGHEGRRPDSTTSCWGGALQSRGWLGRGAWQLLPLFLCSLGLVSVYAPLLGLQVEGASVASHCLSVSMLGLCFLWRSSPLAGGALVPILARRLCADVWLPLQRALWQPLTAARAGSLQLLAALLRGARRCLLRLLRHLRGEAGLALVSVAQWAYYSLVDFHHENSEALGLLLQAVLRQVAVSLLLRGLDRLWAARGQMTWAVWARQHWAASRDLAAITTSLPATSVPFSQRFPGPDPAALRKLLPASISLCLVAEDTDASEGEGRGGFGATGIPLSTRFRSRRARKMASRASSQQTLAQQVQATCVLIALLYIYAASLFVQILK